MFRIRTTSLLLSVLLLSPALGLAQTPTPKPKPTPAVAAPAGKATTGVVKTVTDTSLVITHPTGTVKEMTFVLNASTQRKGTVAVGANVEVRYTVAGKVNTATAVTVKVRK